MPICKGGLQLLDIDLPTSGDILPCVAARDQYHAVLARTGVIHYEDQVVAAPTLLEAHKPPVARSAPEYETPLRALIDNVRAIEGATTIRDPIARADASGEDGPDARGNRPKGGDRNPRGLNKTALVRAQHRPTTTADGEHAQAEREIRVAFMFLLLACCLPNLRSPAPAPIDLRNPPRFCQGGESSRTRHT